VFSEIRHKAKTVENKLALTDDQRQSILNLQSRLTEAVRAALKSWTHISIGPEHSATSRFDVVFESHLIRFEQSMLDSAVEAFPRIKE
jgi:hypothetical protein